MATFWNDRKLEPKRSFKYLMNFSKWGIDYIIKTTDKPSFEVSETEHQFLNHTYYYPGRVTWGEITVTMVDPASPDASATLETILGQSGYNLPFSREQATSDVVTKEDACDALGTVYIKQIGRGASDVIEEWTLENAWIKNVEFGSLDYGSEDMVEISITIRYDFAFISQVQGGTF
jgi:hypothetical protein